jgi:hypothetical protein
MQLIVARDLITSAFATAEFALFISHLMVHLGIKNPKLSELSTKTHYFIFDCVMTFINLYWFWNRYYIMKPILIFAIIVHIFYVSCMFFREKICRIFYWSCLECNENRFGSKFLKENIETAIDILCHFSGFYMFFRSIVYPLHRLLSLGASILTIFFIYKFLKSFRTEEYMMPRKLIKYFK